MLIVTINAGSSSLKFAAFDVGAALTEVVRGQISGIGSDAELTVTRKGDGRVARRVDAPDHRAAIAAAMAELSDAGPIRAVGHRIVHGGADLVAPAVLTEGACQALEELVPLAPLHQPANLAGVRAARDAFPDAVQIGCFDTAFHVTQPEAVTRIAIPKRFRDKGVRRYGFHGLSYAYIASQLTAHEPDLAAGRVVVAHLGNGASLCAMVNGKSVATTMGFSVLEGVPMGTRSGRIDPGVLLWMMQSEGMSADEIARVLYAESGLLGLSGLSNDMRSLEASEDPDAKIALDVFAGAVRAEIAAMASRMGGIDGLVFCGGIGENSPSMRARICQTLDWCGIRLDERANMAAQTDIGSGVVSVRIIPTDEERYMAGEAAGLLAAT